MKTNNHSEEDSSKILDNDMHREYQPLMGMLQRTVSLCRIDICYALSSLSQFCSSPRKSHLSRVLCIQGYLKKYPNLCIALHPNPMEILGETIDCSLLSMSDQYVYPHEELDPKFPAAKGERLDVSIYFNSDHAHDKKTGRSISRVVAFFRNSPMWKLKCQGAVQTSTFGAEFSAMRLATEEAIAIIHRLRSMGIKTSFPSNILGDNAGVLISATSNEANLKTKHVVLSSHRVQENVSYGTIKPYQVGSKDNIADLLTKPVERGSFMQHTGKLLRLNHGI
jgi:hypothetical protein